MPRSFWWLFGLLAFVLILNAWVVDDAYITFRTVDNFLHGYGLRWNVDERVQAYTHPLWMLLMAGVAAVTGEFFYSSIALSLLCSLFAVFLAARFVARSAPWKAPALIVAVLGSKAVLDYASSGLETPLSYVIVAAFAVGLLGDWTDRQKLVCAGLCASLSFITRPDSVLLFVPAMLFLLWRTRAIGPLALTSLPAVAWVAFSLIYYGFPLPNTAYAKELATGFPSSWLVRRGFEYFANSIAWDTASHVMLIGAAVLAVGRPFERLIMAGVGLEVASVIARVASTTHMSGRHFAIPFFVAIIVFVRSLDSRRLAMAWSLALGVYLLANPISPLKFGTRAYHPYVENESFIDAKRAVWREGAAIASWRPGRHLPDHRWFDDGARMRESSERVFVGIFGGEPIGYAGFAAGPDKFIIDILGLSDPLLARLPAVRPPDYHQWKSGHFHRDVPPGYVASVTYNGDIIEDPEIRAYYAAIRTVTRAPVWSRHRFRQIARLNLGYYDLRSTRNLGP